LQALKEAVKSMGHMQDIIDIEDSKNVPVVRFHKPFSVEFDGVESGNIKISWRLNE
jgi:hypothetical protein